MKKIYALMTAAACAICLAGCVKDSLSADEAVPQGEEMIICGTMGDLVEDGAQAPADTPDTRTMVRNTKEVWWRYSDVIAVYMSTNTTRNRFTSTLPDGESAKTSYFSGTISQTGSKYYVGYPAATSSYSTSSDGTLTLEVKPNQPVPVAGGSFNTGTLPSYGSFSSSSKDFTMKPAAGGLKFHVSRDDIRKVTFEGNNGEKVAGKVTVAKLSKTPDISRGSDGYTSVNAIPSSGNFVAGADYFIVITPGSLSKGFTITLTTDGGESLVVKSTKSRTIKAGVFGTLTKALDEYARPTPKAVDLGLPSGTMWATFNVGASKPEEYGDYFAWGEIQPKSDYSWSTYKWCNGDYNKLTKYCTDSSYWDGYYLIDNKTVLDSEDDAASANWEGFWRIPTDADWTELRENCTWTWTSDYNGTSIAGRIVTSNMTGYEDKSIFLPAAGFRSGTGLYDVGSRGYYWSSSLSTGNPSGALDIGFYSDDVDRGGSYRDDGQSVRPVFGKLYPVTTVSLSEQTINVGVGKSASCQVTIKPTNATEKTLTIQIADTSVASAGYNSTTGTITIYGLAPGTTTVRAYASSGANASCEIKVFKEAQAVDMGLPSGTKWANWNVGATNPEEYGDYFAWGETKPKYNYEWSTYKWCKGNGILLTKYCTDDYKWSGEGSKDNKTVLDPEDDAASAIWGGSWRMPTDEDWKELYDNCTLTWKTDNSGIAGHSGLVVTASNGNSIFLPAGGCRDQTYLQDDGDYGYYWSSTLYSDYPDCAWYIYFFHNNSLRYSLDRFERCMGRTVRAVQP